MELLISNKKIHDLKSPKTTKCQLCLNEGNQNYHSSYLDESFWLCKSCAALMENIEAVLKSSEK